MLLPSPRSPLLSLGLSAISLGALSLGVPSTATAASINASSTATTEAGKQGADLAADGLLSTGWAEGVSGDGDGEWLELDLGRSTKLTSISIWPGDMRQGKRSFRESGRPRQLTILVDGQPVGDPVRLVDQMQRLDVPVDVTGRKIRVVIDESYGGMVFSDTHIAEIAVNFPELGPKGDAWTAWLDSSGAALAHEKFEAELAEHYATYKAADFGDRDALAWISDAAAEGEPWLRQAAQSRVGPGYRAQAIISSARAQEALRKLKDANAIPSLQMAMLRSVGEDREILADTVEIFTAYQELVGNQGRTALPWGEAGFWKGALRSFDEPLAIERDVDGNIYVADTGNNRLQRFGDNGLATRSWPGGDPEITDAWFEEGRSFYVSGSIPGDSGSSFTGPLDVELIPGKGGTGFAVIDASKRVVVFDASGAPKASWTVKTDNTPHDGRGGEAYLAWMPKKNRLLAFVGNEAIGYDLSGTEVDRWDIDGGTPDAVEVMKNGVLMLAFRDEIWQYSADGFPHSVRMDETTLGRGFEDLDLTLDEDGKLWVLTDDGTIHKFKKPGKLDFQVQLASYSLQSPRLTVFDGMVWYTSDDSITKIDAYQAWMDEVNAPDEGGALDLDEIGR